MIVLLLIQQPIPLQLEPLTAQAHFAEQLLELEFQLVLAILPLLLVVVRILTSCFLLVSLAIFLQVPQLVLTLGFL